MGRLPSVSGSDGLHDGDLTAAFLSDRFVFNSIGKARRELKRSFITLCIPLIGLDTACLRYEGMLKVSASSSESRLDSNPVGVTDSKMHHT